MDTVKFYLLLSMLFALGNIILSATYYFKIREIWRYIKLFYILANMLVFVMLFQSYMGTKPSGEMQIMSIIVLLSSQFAGLLVSIIKVRASDYIVKEFHTKEDLSKNLKS